MSLNVIHYMHLVASSLWNLKTVNCLQGGVSPQSIIDFSSLAGSYPERQVTAVHFTMLNCV